MIAESIDPVLYSRLEALHDEKRYDGSSKTYCNTRNGYLMNDGRKTLALSLADSFGYEIRKVQGMA